MNPRDHGRGYAYLGLLVLGLLLMGTAQAVYHLRSGGVRAPSSRRSREIRVEVQPPAGLYLDGEFLGKSPLELRIPAGRHLLEARRPGYQPYTHLVDLPTGEDAGFIHAVLEPVPTGTIEVVTTPPACRVFVDGVHEGYSPMVLETPAGEHQIELEKTHHLPHQARLRVRPGVNPPLKVELKDKVLEFLTAAVLAEPDRVAHHADLAHYYYMNDRLDEAAQAYRRALEAACRPKAVRDEVERLNKVLKMRVRQRQSSPAHARFAEIMEKTRDELRQKYPGNVRLLEERSRELERQHKLTKALDLWRNGAKANPTNPEIHVQHARIALRMRKGGEAHDALSKAVKTAGDDFAVLSDAGRITLQYYKLVQGEERERIAKLVQEKIAAAAIQHEDVHDAHRAYGWFLTARIHEDCRRYEEGAKAYAEGIELQPTAHTRGDWRSRRAELLGRLGKKEEGIREYEEAMKDAEGTPQKETFRRRLERFRRVY